jgi:hypothetical protein
VLALQTVFSNIRWPGEEDSEEKRDIRDWLTAAVISLASQQEIGDENDLKGGLTFSPVATDDGSCNEKR